MTPELDFRQESIDSRRQKKPASHPRTRTFRAGWHRRRVFYSQMLSQTFPLDFLYVRKVRTGRERLVCTFGTFHGATMGVDEGKKEASRSASRQPCGMLELFGMLASYVEKEGLPASTFWFYHFHPLHQPKRRLPTHFSVSPAIIGPVY